MNFAKRMFKGLAITGLMVSFPLFASSSNSSQESHERSVQSSQESHERSMQSSQESHERSVQSSRESHERSVQSAQESRESSAESEKASHESSVASAKEHVMKAVGKHARKKIKMRKLNRLLNCATSLVEYQFNGQESAMAGLELMNEVSTRLQNENYEYADLTKSCKRQYKKYRKAVRKKTAAQDVMSQKESVQYLTKVEQTFTDNPSMLDIARKALNPSFDCRKATGWDFKIGLVGSISLGWDHYTCKTPLGRKYHIMGPTAGFGMGFGVTFDGNVADRTRFTIPMRSCMGSFARDDARSKSVLFGSGKTYTNNQEEKSNDFSLGLGFHTTERGLMLMKIRRFPDFNSSSLYSLLKVPTEVNL